MQTLLAQVSLLDNQFGIDDMHLTSTAQVIEHQIAAMKKQNVAVNTKNGNATQKMDVAQELLPATRSPESPEFIIRTEQAEAIISAKDAEMANIKSVYESQTKGLTAEMKIKADKEHFSRLRSKQLKSN